MMARGDGDGHADLTYVYAAAREIATAVTGFIVIITISTVPVGTGDDHEIRPDAGITIVSNPEFLREGTAIQDIDRNSRLDRWLQRQ